MTTNKFEWIFFDLDGTLANSIGIMYNVYIEFLKDFKKNGNTKEFEKLNGPSLNEIISYLKKKYTLKPTTKKLKEKYELLLKKSYTKKVKPIKGSSSLLKKLYNKKYKLAIVSSAPKSIVLSFLKKNNWSDYFSIIISGDEVKKSKPFPDLYDLCVSRAKTNKKNILVVEDSKNGYESAVKAGLQCILLNNKNINLKSVMSVC